MGPLDVTSQELRNVLPEWMPAGRVLRYAALNPDAVAIHQRSGAAPARTTYREMAELVRRSAGALHAAGVQPGARVLLHAGSSPQWLAALLGAQAVGAIPFGAYPTSSGADVAHLLCDAMPQVTLIGGSVQRAAYDDAIARGAVLAPVVFAMDLPVTEPGSWQRALAEVADTGWPQVRLSPDDTAVIVYTSGSTGAPKGAMLSYANLAVARDLLADTLEFTDEDVLVSYLPMNHIAEQAATVYMALARGAEIYLAPSTQDVFAELAAVHPTVFLAVPRILEKLMAASRAGATPADLGIDRVRYITSSGAPASEDVYAWAASLGIVLREGWGLTETSGCITFTARDLAQPGTVGTPLPGHTIRLADDGEIFVKGVGVFKGYWHRPESTQEAIDGDGWLHTGDIGMWDESQGENRRSLKIIGRKKDLIITAGGKNVAPADTEAALMRSPLIDHAVLVGDRMPYISALIDINDDSVRQHLGISGASRDELTADSRVLELIQRVIDEVNADLARVAQVRRFRVLPRPVGTLAGELTATQKLKRAAVVANFAAAIEDMYAAGASERNGQ